MAPTIAPAQGSHEPEAPSPRWAIASLSLSMLLSSLGTSIANVALPTLAQEFDATFQQAQWIVLAYLLAITTLIVSIGRLGDLVGRRRLLLSGILLFVVASAACAAASTLWALIAGRAIQGVGAAVMMALTMAFVGETVPKNKTGRAMGLLGTMSAVGTALGPTLGGILIAGIGWPAVFLINLPLGLAALLLAYRFLPADRPRGDASRPRFDHLGTVLLAATLGAYALAMTIGRGNFGLWNLIFLLVAVVGAALFIVAEKRAPAPLIRLSMFQNRVLSAGFGMSVLVTTVMMATLVVGPFYLSGALALNAAHTGLAMSAGPIVAALAGIPAGRMVDRFSAQRMTAAGLIVMLAGCLLLPILPSDAGVSGYVAPLMLMTAGYALFQAANNTSVMTSIGPDDRGVVAGIVSLARNLGLVTGASVMGSVFAFGAGANDIAAATAQAVAAGMRTTFMVASVLVALTLAIALRSGKKSGSQAL